LRFGLIDLRLGLIDLLVLAVDLRLDIVDIAACDLDLCFRLIDGDPVIAIVNPGEKIAGLYMLVVGDRHVRDIAADLRRDGKAARRDEGIIGRFVMAGLEPIGETADQRNQQQACTCRCQHPMLAEPVLERSRWLACRVLPPFTCFPVLAILLRRQRVGARLRQLWFFG
jgi:hypothetical protein